MLIVKNQAAIDYLQLPDSRHATAKKWRHFRKGDMLRFHFMGEYSKLK